MLRLNPPLKPLKALKNRARVIVAFATALLFVGVARAEPAASTGLWPDVSIPSAELRAEPSKDAALVVGIERYDALPKIAGAAENARDWEKYFLFGRRIPPERVRLLTDQSATVEAISARARELAAQVPEGGTFFVIFIGHGAPAEGGQKGLLLGADVRPSDASFAARSLSYDQLVGLTSAGKQERTIMVLDACFSGVSNEGKTLLTNVQPVIATSLITPSKTTLFSAGTSGEYAGALPGSQRPALSYLLLGALRGWADSNGDGKITSAEAHAYASLVLRSLPNNHEQHPQLATDAEGELLESGKEPAPDLAVIRSKLDAWSPPVDAAPAPPKLRVAVGCGESEPLGTDDGLALYLDHSPTVTLATGGEKVWDATLGRNVVRNIEFPITKGRHHLLVRLPGCEPSETEIDVDAIQGAEAFGTLKSNTGLLLRGPAGTPNWGRIALSAWLPQSLSGYRHNLQRISESAGLGGLDYRLVGAGVMAQPGLAFRWWTAGLDLGFASGHGERAAQDPLTARSEAATATPPDLTWFRVGMRVGARFPFHYVTAHLGVGGGYDNQALTKLPQGVAWTNTDHGYTSGWFMLEGTALCEWQFFGGVHVDLPDIVGPFGHFAASTALLGIQLGAAFQPNEQCARDRSTRYGVEARRAQGAAKK